MLHQQKIRTTAGRGLPVRQHSRHGRRHAGQSAINNLGTGARDHLRQGRVLQPGGVGRRTGCAAQHHRGRPSAAAR